jgi:putative membrane protein
LKRCQKPIALLGVICAVVWILSAIHPVDRQAWILESLLVFIFVAVLALIYRYLDFSNASYLCIALFLVIHAIGAHYTYAHLPIGNWAKEVFGLSRNHADRIAHFAFGLLLSYPIRELVVRFGRIQQGWSFWLPPFVILAASGLFEILESMVAEIFAPGKGADWLGARGDEWDAQNDMLSAFIGAGLMMAVVALIPHKESER